VIVERRLLLHERIGAALESLYSGSLDDHLAELAHHYRTAGKAADPEKAIDYSIRAGRAAYAVFAYEEAGTHWRAALGLMPEGGEDRERRADLLERLGELLGMNALMNAPDTGEYVHYLEQARKLYEDLGQLEAAARVHSRLAAWELVRHKVDMSRVLEHNRRAQDFLSDTPEGLSAVLLYVGLGVTALEGMRYDEALTATRRAMDLSERLGDEIYWARAGVVHALAHCFRGRMAEGFALLSRIRAKADQLDDLLTAVSAISAAEYTHIFLLNPFEVAARVEQELAKPRTSKAVLLQKALIHLIGLSRLLMGKVTEVGALVEQAQGAPLSDGPHLEARFSFYLGDWRRAELILEQAMNEELQADRLLRFCICGQLAARILRSQGRTAEAESILQKTLAICVTSSATLIELAVQQELALVCTDTGRLEQARLHIERCREIQSNGEDWRGLATNTMRAEAVLATAETRLEDAQGQFAKAVEVYRHYLLPFEEAETMHWWGRAVLAAGEPVRAVEKFDAAIEIYRSRGAGARFIEYVMEDKRRAQRSNSTHAEVQSPTDSTQAVPRRVTQERPNLVAHPPSNASGSRKLGPG
jgi:tetratricopeptide (TPR) repeat protein